MHSLRHYLLVPVAVVFFLGAWKCLVLVTDYPSYILPPPERVGSRLVAFAVDGQLTRHVGATSLEVFFGFLLGTTAGIVAGYPVAKSKTLERIALPYIVAAQSIPIVALAPLMILWFGTGYWSKILVSALIVFFPMLINTIAGFQRIELPYKKLMASLHATPWQTFRTLEIYMALPSLFAGFKIAAPLAVVGAVVGEFLGANRGLGFVIRLAQGLMDTPLLFGSLIALVVMGVLIYQLFALLEKLVLRRVRLI